MRSCVRVCVRACVRVSKYAASLVEHQQCHRGNRATNAEFSSMLAIGKIYLSSKLPLNIDTLTLTSLKFRSDLSVDRYFVVFL